MFDIEKYAKLAIDVANQSPCHKSKRGVAIISSCGTKSVFANNSPPEPFYCDGSCIKYCNKVAVHAEERAILSANFDLVGSEVVHVKAVGGKLVYSGPPSCWQCSRMLMEVKVSGVWLYHKEGWKRYDMLDFHKQTLSVCELNCPY